jgi:hypothetical protein
MQSLAASFSKTSLRAQVSDPPSSFAFSFDLHEDEDELVSECVSEGVSESTTAGTSAKKKKKNNKKKKKKKATATASECVSECVSEDTKADSTETVPATDPDSLAQSLTHMSSPSTPTAPRHNIAKIAHTPHNTSLIATHTHTPTHTHTQVAVAVAHDSSSPGPHVISSKDPELGEEQRRLRRFGRGLNVSAIGPHTRKRVLHWTAVPPGFSELTPTPTHTHTPSHSHTDDRTTSDVDGIVSSASPFTFGFM